MHLTPKKHLPKQSCYFACYFAACLRWNSFSPVPGYGTETSNGNESTYSPEQYINAANGSKNDNMPLFNLMNLNNVSMPPTVFFTATSNDPLPVELHSFTSDNTTTVTTNGVEGEAIYTPPTAEAFFRVGATVTLSSNASDMHELGVAFANGELGGFWIGGNTANQNYYEGGPQSVTLKLKTGCFGHLKHLWRSDDWSTSVLQDAYMNITPVNAVFNKSNWYLNWSAGANNNLSKFTNPFTHENCSIVGCDHYGALGENTYSIVSGVENVSTLSADRITFNKSAAAVTSPVTIKIASAKNPAWNDTINIFPQYIELYQGNWNPYNLPNEIYVPFADGDLNNNGLIDSSEASLSMNLFSDLYRVKVRKLLHKSERNILFSFMPKASTIKILDGSTLYRALNNAPIPVKFQSSSSEFAVILLRYFPTTLLNAHYDLNYNDNPTVYEAIQGDNVRTTSNKFAIDKPDYYEYLELNDQVTIKGYGVDLAYPALLESSGSGVNASVDIERYIGGEIRVANPGRPAIIGTLTASSLGNLEDFVTANQTKNYTLSLGLSGNGELIPPANAENFDFINIPNPIGGGAFSFKATSDSISKRSIEAILSLNENGTAIHQDKLKLTALRFDVDIDSNGDGVIRCEYPTAAESEAISNGTATPEVLDKIADEMGKMNAFVPVNAGDKDGDGIADVNDYQISSATFNENVFKAVQITLPQSIQRSNYKIYINQPSTAFQLWKKPSNVLRTAADKVNSGYYNVEDLPSTLYLEAKQAVSSPIQIDFTLQPITNKVPSSSSTLETLDLAVYPAKLTLTESIAVWSDTITLQSVSCGNVVSTVTNAADITDAQTIYVPAVEDGYVVIGANFNCSVAGMNYLPTWTASESNVLSVPNASELPQPVDNSKKYIKVNTSSPRIITASASYNNTFFIKFIPFALQFTKPSGDPVAAPSENNEFVFSSENDGILTLNLEAQVIPSIAASKVKNSCTFSVDDVGTSIKEWSATTPDGKPVLTGDKLSATVTFTNLPDNNSALGLKKARLNCTFGGNNEQEANYEVFYDAVATNHPSCSSCSGCPNWFYYYKQASGGGSYKYKSTGRSESTSAGGDSTIKIANEAYAGDKYITTQLEDGFLKAKGWSNTNKYYPNFCGVLAHERQHANGEQNPPGGTTDRDSDWLINDFETDTSKTDPDIKYSASTWGGGFSDDEIYAGGTIEQAGIASADTNLDWAYPGTNSKQP